MNYSCSKCEDTMMVDDPEYPNTTEWVPCPDCFPKDEEE